MFREIRRSERTTEDIRIRKIRKEYDRLVLKAADVFMFLPNGEKNPESEEAWRAVDSFKAMHPDVFPPDVDNYDVDDLVF